MAMTHDYLDYLNEKVGICPAGSQEELQAADVIADLMRQHDVEPSVEEFDAKTFGGTVPSVLYVLMFIGIVLGGIGVPVLTALGFVLAVCPAALFVLKYFGHDFISPLGPTTRSQNVVAFHKACGPMVIKGNRPIVIVAHYDSPHENVLASSPAARFVPLAWKVSKYCVAVVAACMLFQVLGFLPGSFRRFMWVIGILAALPLVMLGVTGVLEHFSDCTDGANDNKSGVAAMLGVLENVRPSGLESVHGPESIDEAVEAMKEAAENAAARAAAQSPDDQPEIAYAGLGDKLASIEPAEGADPFAPAEQGATAMASGDQAAAADQAPAEEVAEEAPAEPEFIKVPGEVFGVRHGENIVKSLGMLSDACDVEYVDPEPVLVPAPARKRPARRAAVRAAAAPAQSVATAAPAAAQAAPADQPAVSPTTSAVPAPAASRAAERTAPAASAAGAAFDDSRPAARPGVTDFTPEQEPDFEPLPVDAYNMEGDKPTVMETLMGVLDRAKSAIAGLGEKFSSKRGEDQPAWEGDAPAEWDAYDESAEGDEEGYGPVEDPFEAAAEGAEPESEPAEQGAPAEAVAPDAAEEEAEPVPADAAAPVAPADELATPSADDPAPAVGYADDGYVDEYAPAAEEPADDYAPAADDAADWEPADGFDAAEPAPEPSDPAASAAQAIRSFFSRNRSYEPEDVPDAEYEELPDEQPAAAQEMSTDNLIPFGEEPAQDAPAAQQPVAADQAAQTTANIAVPAEQTAVTPAVAEPQQPAEQTAVTGAAVNFDGLEDGTTLNPDNAGLTAEGDVDAGGTQPMPVAKTRPAAPDDPEWGKTSFRPQPGNVARRATLFDLPDPSAAGNDPFGTDPSAPKVAPAAGRAQASTAQAAGQQLAGGQIETISAPTDEADFAPVEPQADAGEGIMGKFKGLFSKSDAEEDEPSAGKHSGKHGGWKGGAAPRAGLRMVEEGESGQDIVPEGAPDEPDLREAILGLGDDALISHDIWFVALGASDCDHAGMRAFLAEHRQQIRGSFVINLDSVAAGDLTLLTREGLLVTRRADRRMLRMLSTIASDLHLPVEKAKYDWASTDATPAMLSSMRAVTIMGTDAPGTRALSRTAADVAENLVPEQAVAVTEAVTELIRRS